MLQGIIFDLDGTLIDSALDFDAIRRDLGLPDGSLILESLAAVPESPEKDRMREILSGHERAGADRSTFFPGVEDCLRWLNDRRIPTGILTRNSRHSVDRVLARLPLPVDVILTREDAPPKPDPAGLLQIAQRWNLRPHEVGFCGDYSFDLDAGQRAGMPTILYAPGDLPPFAGDATYILNCFTEFRSLFTALFPHHQ